MGSEIILWNSQSYARLDKKQENLLLCQGGGLYGLMETITSVILYSYYAN